MRKFTTHQHFNFSEHARQRCAQRNFRDQDLALVFRYGTPTHEGVLMRDKDVEAALGDLRIELQRLQKLERAA